MAGRVEVIALGGTIASTPRPDGKGVVPGLTAEDLLAAVPAARDLAEIRARTLVNVPSVEIDLPLLMRLADLIQQLEGEGAAGFVITQGTDTIEETAYVLDLLHAGSAPVIVTGAMRNPSLPGPDGPANVYAAIACAADPACRDQGALVVFDDDIHAADWVQKRDTSSVGAFWSPAPLGWMAEGRPALRFRRPRRSPISIPKGATVPHVPILKPGLGEPPHLVTAAVASGAAGIVAELSGGGHASAAWADALEGAAGDIPVVFTSRTRGGRVLNHTYGQTGAEIDLIGRGLLPAGDLDALKARLLLTLLLMAGRAECFADHAELSWRTGE